MRYKTIYPLENNSGKLYLTMRWAKSYSIIDHRLLHGGYLARLSHEAMVLYLFLVVVGDKDGRSFYGDATIVFYAWLPASCILPAINCYQKI